MKEEFSKLKVVLVCHFSNSKVRELLPLDNRRIYTIGRKLLGMPNKGFSYSDVAAWDTYMIDLMRKRDDIELYVISAHSGLKRSVCSFDLEGVHYNFVRCDYATLLKRIIPSPSLWHRLNPMRPKVRKLIKEIKPDVIALIGAENAYYSGTVLGINDIPLIVKCQTIYNNPDRGKYGQVDAKNAYVERLIFDNLQYVSVDSKMHERLFRTMNKTAINFKWQLGTMYPEVKQEEKIYDFVNFAMHMIPGKGYTDVINAMGVVCKRHPDAKLNLIGKGTQEYMEELHQLVASLGIGKNVIFTSPFEQQADLFQHLQKSRFAVLPCKLDYIASTIRQSMHYGLPVLCYKTEGTQHLNKECQCVLLAENSNVEDLADKMLRLLDDSKLIITLAENGYTFAQKDNNDEEISKQMSDVFHAVASHYKYGTPVPEVLIANPNADEKKEN